MPTTIAPTTSLKHVGDPDSIRGVGVAPAIAWAGLVPVLAQRPVMRVSRDGGRTYPASRQRQLTERLPGQPAAVPTFDQHGCTRVLALDFDAKGQNSSLCGDLSGPEAVAKDVATLHALVSPHGGQLIVDESPNGGRHAYLVLDRPAPHHQVVPVMRALASRLPTLDVQPMISVHGLIRPPGARHASGGHQQLLTDLHVAARIAREGNTPAVWEALRRLASPTETSPPPSSGPPAAKPVSGGLTASVLAIARDGDTNAYKSPSEARQAVLTACARRGWDLVDVAGRVEDGRWPGLAQCYARYGRHSRAALGRDWRKAIALVEKQPPRSATSVSVRMQHKGAEVTPPSPTGYQQIRAWETATRICERTRWHDAPTLILIIRALGQIAQRNATMTVDHGDRALSLATGLDIATVSRGLAVLRAEADPVLERILADRGHGLPDVYELRIPTDLEAEAERRPWRPGEIHALRPCFWSLGRVAGFVYEAIARSPVPTDREAIVDEVPYADSAVRLALATLEGWNLIQRGDGGWTLDSTTPDHVAERCGASERFEARVTLYRRQRAAYRALVLRRIPVDPTADPGPAHEPPPPTDPEYEPPPDDLHDLGPPWADTRDQAWLAREATRTDAVRALVDVLGAREVS